MVNKQSMYSKSRYRALPKVCSQSKSMVCRRPWKSKLLYNDFCITSIISNMNKLLLFFVGVLVLQSLQGQVVFKENCENGTGEFVGLKIDSSNPGEGMASAQLQSNDPAKEAVAIAKSTTLLPVKPDTWYRVSFLFRNNIGNGELKYGIQESRSATEMKTDWYSWQWHALPLNIDSWNRYSGEFKTATGTHAVKLYFMTENNLSGCSLNLKTLLTRESASICQLCRIHQTSVHAPSAWVRRPS